MQDIGLYFSETCGVVGMMHIYELSLSGGNRAFRIDLWLSFVFRDYYDY